MKRLLLLCLLLCPWLVMAQAPVKDTTISVALIGAQYAFQIPGGDMAKLYGTNSTIGGCFYFKTRSNWLVGAEFNFLFGSSVKTDPTQSVATSAGFLINGNGEPQFMQLYERGIVPMFKFGKLIPGLGPNLNSGLYFKGGLGFIQHKIKYYWELSGPPQLGGEYIKGYDRLTNGLAISESAGYLHLSNKNYFNFSAELEFTQGFTRNRRDWNYDEMRKDDSKHLDLFYGIKVFWYFPLYGKNRSQVYY